STPSAYVNVDWSQPLYSIRVRNTSIFLWGSAGLTDNVTFDKPLLLHIRNDTFGEPITLGTQIAAGPQKMIGTLQPGECVSIPMQTISGVFATCLLESNVECLIKHSA